MVDYFKALGPKLKLNYADCWQPTGSREICNPPPMDTDEDYIVLTGSLKAFESWAVSCGWSRTNAAREGYPESGFNTFRMGILNLIVTEDQDFYNDFVLATRVCKLLNVMDKSKRIGLFQGVLYGNWEG